MAAIIPEDYQNLLQILEETKKELNRFQSLDGHTATVERGDYIFLYIEEKEKCIVRVYGGGRNGEEHTPTKPLSKEGLETWATIWNYENG